MSRRLWNLMCILFVVALVLAACGPAATPEPEEFVFGVILVGPYNDHGWSEAHYTAAEYVTEKLPNTRFVYLDKLNPADRPETTLEQAVDDMVSQGAKVVFTTSDDFKEDTDLAAEKNSDVTFIHISGDHVLTGDAPPNVDNYMGKMPYGKMIAGCAAIHSLSSAVSQAVASSPITGTTIIPTSARRRRRRPVQSRFSQTPFPFRACILSISPSK